MVRTRTSAIAAKLEENISDFFIVSDIDLLIFSFNFAAIAEVRDLTSISHIEFLYKYI